MIRRSEAKKEIAEKHAYIKKNTRPLFSDRFNRNYYFDGVKIGECIVHDQMDLDINELELFVLNYYQSITKTEEESFYTGINVSKRKALYNPDDQVLVNDDNPIVIAFRDFLKKKKSR